MSPVNPPKKVTPTARVGTIARANSGLAAILLATLSGYTAAVELSFVAVPLALAAALLVAKR